MAWVWCCWRASTPPTNRPLDRLRNHRRYRRADAGLGPSGEACHAEGAKICLHRSCGLAECLPPSATTRWCPPPRFPPSTCRISACRALTIDEVRHCGYYPHRRPQRRESRGRRGGNHAHAGYMIDQFITPHGTSAPTSTAAALKTVCACSPKSTMPSAARGRAIPY